MLVKLSAPLLGAFVWLGGCATVPDTARRATDDLLQPALGAHASLGSASAASSDAELKLLLSAPLDADAAVRIALIRNPAVQIEYGRLGLASADVFEASRLANPAVGLSVLWPTSAAGERKIDGGITLGFTDLLWLRSRRRMAADEFKAAQQQVAAAIFDLALDVQGAWIKALAANQRLAVRERITESAQLAAELAERYRAAGNIDALALALQSAAASEAAIEFRRAMRDSARARARLLQLLGLTAEESSIALPESLPAPLTLTVEPVALRAAARSHRLDLAAAQSEINALERRLAASRRYRWLGYSSVGVIGEREGTGNSRSGASASLALPLFQQGQGTVARAAAGLDQARARARQIEVVIDSELDSQHAQLDQARVQYTIFREQLIPQREAAVARLGERVNFMLAGSFELLAAKQQEYAAYEGSIEALQDYWQARVALARAVGGPLPEFATEIQP